MVSRIRRGLAENVLRHTRIMKPLHQCGHSLLMEHLPPLAQIVDGKPDQAERNKSDGHDHEIICQLLYYLTHKQFSFLRATLWRARRYTAACAGKRAVGYRGAEESAHRHFQNLRN